MIKKIKNKNKEFILLLIVIFQVLLLINMSTANSYIISKTDSLIETKIIEEKNNLKNLINFGINLLIGFLSIKQIGIVSAQDLEMWCCPKTNEGAICQPVSSDFNDCAVNIIETSCGATADCRLGCCFDTEEGLCSTNSPQGKCIDDGGEWNNDVACSTSECRKGCCVLGGNTQFTTEKNCEIISSFQGFNKDFRQIWNEVDCLALSASQFEGACVFGEGACKFEAEVDCLSDGGRFYKDFLCSHEGLETNCEKQDHVGCVEGKDEIYWFDSCNNRENIYSSNKEDSWHGGLVLKKELSCGASSSDRNLDSTSCGNCGRPLTKCSETKTGETHVQDGDFVCKDLSCKDAPANVGTQDRFNGETWCLYDGFIGDGKDTVGSEHWRAQCNEGKVEVDRCGEYRSSLCQEQVIEWENNKFSMATCVFNQQIDCHKISQDYAIDSDMDEEEIEELMEEMSEKCNENMHCMIKNVDVNKYFKFSMCVPRYPKGDDLTDDIDGNGCDMASRECKVYYEKVVDWEGIHWKCKENCKCESKEFSEQMNNFCISMGDCGSYINYIGEGKNNVRIRGRYGNELDGDGKETEVKSSDRGDAPAVYSWNKYIGFADAVEGQYVTPQNMNEFLSSIFGGEEDSQINTEEIVMWTAGITGVIGAGFTVATLIAGGTLGVEGGLMTTWGLSATLGGIANAFVGAAIGAALGFFLAKALGMSGDMAVVMMILGGIAGAGVGLGIIGGSSAVPLVGWIVAAVVAVIMALLAIFEIGKMETRIVKFECLPWTAPNGGENCGKCNEDPLRPCTEYRCSSLGQLCELINKNEENPVCISKGYESNPPVISAGEVKTDGYEFSNEQDKRVELIKSNGDCIQEFSSVLFTLETDEYAQCKYSFEKPSLPSYEDMDGEDPLEKNLFSINHTFGISVPSIDSFDVYDITEEVEGDLITLYGDMNMYVKCQDGQEPPNFNIDEYVVNFCIHSGPDETAVDFNQIYSDPENGATLKYGTNKTNLKIWLSEPAECSYDVAKDKEYENMEFPMECETGVFDADLNGWLCETTLTNLVKGKNEFFIRCKDTSGNVNGQSHPYTIHVSESELKIDSVSFNYDNQVISSGGTFVEGFEPISVEMKVKTSGGADNGKSACYWGTLKNGDRHLFYDTFSNIHEQLLTPRLSGTHTTYIKCEDDAGNEVKTTTQFTVNVDSSPPIIVRAYKQGGSLKLITNEQAKCYYDFDRCYFDLESGTSMTTAFSTVHITNWNPGVTYHIKCKDIFGNINTDCAKKIIPSS